MEKIRNDDPFDGFVCGTCHQSHEGCRCDEGDAAEDGGPGSPLQVIGTEDGSFGLSTAIPIAPTRKPKIYCTVNGGSEGWWNAIAIAEDGTPLAGHICSAIAWARHDLGVDNDTMGKHKHYRAYYPDGYEMVWVRPDEMRAQIQAQNGPMYEVYLRNKDQARVSDHSGREAGPTKEDGTRDERGAQSSEQTPSP